MRTQDFIPVWRATVPDGPYVGTDAIHDGQNDAPEWVQYVPTEDLQASILTKVPKGAVTKNVADYGANGNNSFNNTAAFDACLAALINTVPFSGGATVVMELPPGIFLTMGGHVASVRVIIKGAGRYATTIRRISASTNVIFSLNASHTTFMDVCIDGNRFGAGTAGASIEINAAYCSLMNLFLNKSAGNAITIGNTGIGIVTNMFNVMIRLAREYGVEVIGGSGSTDGTWANMDIGICGKSGVKISTGSQLLVNVHTWGCGTEDPNDKHGFWLNSSANKLINCEGETNLGYGCYITGNDNTLMGGMYWANMGSGVYGFNADRTTVKCSIYRNGMANTSGSSTTLAFIGCVNDGGKYWLLDIMSYDTSGAKEAYDYTDYGGGTPTYPYLGRDAIFTQAYHYGEDHAADFNVVGGIMRKEDTRTGQVYYRVDTLSGNGNVWSQASQFGAITPLTIASAATVRVPTNMGMEMAYVSGGATITTIAAPRAGRSVTLIGAASSSWVVNNTGNVRLSGGTFTAAVDRTITFKSDGTNWYETARVV